MTNSYAGPPNYELRQVELAIHSGDRTWHASGTPRSWVPVRHRQPGADGGEAILRILKSPSDWTFEGRAGQRVLITMRRTRPLSLDSLFLDPLIFLMRTDESGVDVVESLSDDAQEELDAEILTTLERDGRYRIIATRIGDTFGRYVLTFQLGDAGR